MAPKSLGLWMLFLWIQEGESTVNCGTVTGILRKAVELQCCYKKDFNPDLFRVQWQLQGNDDCVVDAWLPGQSPPPQCEHYKNRTELKNLHLQLLSVTLEDSKIYECILQKMKDGIYQTEFQGQIRLESAANESQNATYLVSTTIPPGMSAGQQQTQVIALSCLVVLVIFTIIIFIFLYKRKRAYTAPVDMETS